VYADSASVICGAMLSWTIWRTALDQQLDTGTRSAWRWIAVAVTMQWFGNIAWWHLETVRHVSPQMSYSDVLYLPYYPAMLVGLLRFPHARRARTASYWLDVAIVLTAGAISVWHYLSSAAFLQTTGSLFSDVEAIAYPLRAVLILIGVVLLLLWHAPQPRSAAPRLLAFGLLIALGGDVVYAFEVRTGTYSSGSLLDAVWALAWVFLARAASRERANRADAVIRAQTLPASRVIASLPYVAVSLMYFLLLARVVSSPDAPLQFLVVGAAIVTTMSMARQFISGRQNLRLVHEAKALESEARFRALVQHSSDLIFITDVDSTIRYGSPAACKMLGVPDDGLAGLRLMDLVHHEDMARLLRLISHVASGQESAREECRLRGAEGAWIPMEHVATNLLDEHTIRGVVLNSRDVSERVELETRLTHQAFHDPLTQLANRTLFLVRVDHAMRLSMRDRSQVAMLFIDVDDFKRVNDSLGHSAGDALLIGISDRLKRVLRDGDTLARRGGDEFGVLLESVGGVDRAAMIADRVQRISAEPIVIEGKEIVVELSIGLASGVHADGARELMRNADLAMYVAKTRGKRGCARYEPHMHTDILARVELEADLRRAIDRGELTLLYQPVMNLETREIAGVEALVRWNHPTRGLLPPSEFIPVAEGSGLVLALGRWVLHEACQQARRWRDATGFEIHVGVNLSGRHIQSPTLVDDVREALLLADIDPRQLLLEITESTLMQEGERVHQVLQELKGLGITIALDDFGTGYSSLSYLQKFPIDVLKIDKSFVRATSDVTSDTRLIRAIIALAESLGLRAIAEGIETPEQLETLRTLGCVWGQGYLLAYPESPSHIQSMMLSGKGWTAVKRIPTRPLAVA
jgi:diguanylate cyclase (GGDEF)-like protein/PAS domain S-box-containing protein